MRNRKISLTYKVLLAFVLVLLPIFVVFAISTHENRKHLESLVLTHLRTLAEGKEGDLLIFLELNRQRIEDFSSDGMIKAGIKGITEGRSTPLELEEYLRRNKFPLARSFDSISVFSKKGKLLAASARPHDSEVLDKEFFIKGLEGPTMSQSSGELVFSAPVRSEDGTPIGVISGFYRIEDLSGILTGEFTKGLGATSMREKEGGKTLEVYIVGRERFILTQSKFYRDAPGHVKVDTMPVRECLERRAEADGFYRDYRGVEVAGAGICMPSLGWTLLTEVDKDEILAPVTKISLFSLMTVTITAGLLAGLGWFFMRAIVGQIRVLTSAAREMAAGNYNVSVSPVSGDELGELSEYFNIMAREIRERTLALQASEKRLEEAQRIAHIGGWEWNIKENREHWSEETYRIFGLTRDKYSATYEAFLSMINPDDRGAVEKAIDDSFREKKPYAIDYRIIRGDGEERVIHSEAEVEFGPGGEPLKMTGTNQDITERKRAEDEIRKLNAELEKRVTERTAELEATNRELEAFSYSVAHDLKAPLRIINGFSRVIEEDFGIQLGTEGLDYIKRVRTASFKMEGLISELLDLSRVIRSEMRRENVDLSALASAICNELRSLQPGRKAEVVIKGGLSAVCDPKLMRIALENLLGNAWKFTSNTAEPLIEFGVVRDECEGQEGARPVFYVKDNGAGFDKKYTGRLFIPFQRLHTAEEFPGTGIGLATVQRIIARHGGRVWAEGEKGSGAVFYFTF